MDDIFLKFLVIGLIVGVSILIKHLLLPKGALAFFISVVIALVAGLFLINNI
ncbi:MAG: hypothetical protein ACRCVG_06930 [Methanobacteriaceae archaeon]